MKRLETWNGYPILDDDSPADAIYPANYARGMVPRNLVIDPPTMFAPPSEIDLIDPSEDRARIEAADANESSLEHLYLRAGWENLDQSQDGYCWVYSGGHTIMLVRTRDGQPYVRLNPHAAGAIVKNGRNEGGWCGLGAKFYREVGCPLEGTGPGEWPFNSRNLKYDTPEMRAAAAKNKITEDWVDLASPVYDQNLTFRQVVTCLHLNIPCMVDFNHWSHSVCGVRIVQVEAGSLGLMILNSWKGWGRRGLGILRGSKMYPDGAVATRGVRAAA